MKPTIAAIIPTFNSVRYLKFALESVMTQTRLPDHIIVVDDGSDDGTRDFVTHQPAHINYTYQPNAGVAAARQTGIGLTDADIIAFLDADDIWPANKLAQQLGVWKSNQSKAGTIALGMTQAFYDDDPATLTEPFLSYLFGASLISRDLFTESSVNAQLTVGEDVDWFLRAREVNANIVTSNETALHYRQRKGSLTAGKDATQRGLPSLLKSSLDRRRALHGGAPELPPHEQDEPKERG